MPLKTKYGLLILVLFAVTTAAVLFLQIRWIDQLVIDQTTKRIAQHIRTAWNVVDQKTRTLEAVTAFLAERQELGKPLNNARAPFQQELKKIAGLAKVDFICILDKDSEVVVRSNSPKYGDVFEIDGLWDILNEEDAVSGFAIIPKEIIANENQELAQRCRMGDGLAIITARKITQKTRGHTAVVMAGVFLNGNEQIVETIQETLFEDVYYKGIRAGTATIFQGPVRIATTVMTATGQRALGTQVSQEVAREVLVYGRPWTGPAKVLDHTYITQYDPIIDISGNVVGMLYIGELQQIYTDMRRKTVITNALVLLGILALVFLATHIVSLEILKQIYLLKKATHAFADGDYSARVRVRTSDELGSLARAFNRMADLIQQDRDEIVRQKEEIEQANNSYMEMLSFVSHEFRSSLSSALLNGQLMLNGSYGKLVEDQQEGMDLIINSLTYLEEITETYLQLSRMERNELLVKPSRHTLGPDIIEPVRYRLNTALANKEMSLTADIPHDLEIYADATLMRVVFENLLGNAIKYGFTGGTITISAKHLADQHEIRIFNEGHGIPEAHIAHIFDKFQRYDVEESTGKTGTGLGLFIVKQIITKHGGDIRAESSPGQNAVFIFTLPDNPPLFSRDEAL